MILNPTPDFPHFYYKLGGNLGSLLYGDVSVMLFMSLLSQEIENQQITSLKYTVVLPRLRQNERNMVFGMLVAGTSENELQVCFVVFVFLFITS